METHDQRPTVSRLIVSLMPEASLEEQLEAEQNLNEFLSVAYRMYLRLEAEGKLGDLRRRREEREDKN